MYVKNDIFEQRMYP